MQGSGITIHTSFDTLPSQITTLFLCLTILKSFDTIVSLLLHCCYNDYYINTNRPPQSIVSAPQ